MQNELTLGEVFEEISERLAEARTRALMGEREEALGIFHGAALEFTRFREVLRDYPGYHALEHAFEVTMTALCGQQEPEEAYTEIAEEITERSLPFISRRKPRTKLRQAA